MRLLAPLQRWMYSDGRPNALARTLNRISATQFSRGILSPRNWVTLEVRGRRSGRLVTCPVVVADHGGERFLVSMLGQGAGWVRNVRAADGRAVLERRGREAVGLVEVDVTDRAPVLRRYLELAPGARPHFPVDRRAPLSEFVRIAADFPVFRITRADRRPVDPLP